MPTYYPLKVQIDLPMPVPHPKEPGWAYEHRFTAPDYDYVFNNTWRDPIRHTVMLMPWQLTPEFETTYGGLLKRLSLADYFTDSSAVSTQWDTINYHATGNTFLFAKNTNERLTTIKKWMPNQAFFLQTFAFGPFSLRDTWFEFEIGVPTVAGTAGFKFVVRYDGSFDTYKDGVKGITDYLTPGNVDRQTFQHKPLQLMIIPYRRNQILIWTNQGAYPVFTDYDLSAVEPNGKEFQNRDGYGDIDPSDYVITPYGHAAIKFPIGKGFFQLTPVVYKIDFVDGTGSIGPLDPPRLPYAPNSANFPDGTAITSGFDRDAPASSAIDMTPGIVADGVDRTADLGYPSQADWLITFTGNQVDPDFGDQSDRTPFAYGFGIQVPTGQSTTPDDTNSIEHYVLSLTHRHAQDGTEGEIAFKDPLVIDPTGSYYTALNRPLRLYREVPGGGEDEFFFGDTAEPHFGNGQLPVSPDGIDHTPVVFKILDPWHRFENILMKNFRALDGMRLDLAIREILKKAGWPDNRVDIDESNVYLPSDERGTEKLVYADEIGNLKDFLRHLCETYTSSNVAPNLWIMDFAPVILPDTTDYTICFRFKDPENLPDADSPNSTRRWYATQADATTAGASWEDWVTDFDRNMLMPEANYIEVWGEDPDGVPIAAIREDKASQNSSLAFADRPLNWVGMVMAVIYINPAFNTTALVEGVADTLLKRLSPPRFYAEWSGQMSYDDRIFDIHKMVHDDNRRYHLLEFDVTHILEGSELIVRNTKYRGETHA